VDNIFQKALFHIRRLPEYIRKHPKIIIDYLYLSYYGVETKYGYVRLEGFPIIRKTEGSRIILEKGCTLVSKSKYNYAGINHPVILATLTSSAVIKIGKVGISGSSICAATGISIDDYSGLGANSSIYDTDFHPINANDRRNQQSILDAISKPVVIGKDVWVAANAIILKGVTIGDGAVIGAGSVVTSNISEKAIYAGNPAKKIKEL
jgi:acetyltransferase-like isoleucine patch superfamily enzyme